VGWTGHDNRGTKRKNEQGHLKSHFNFSCFSGPELASCPELM
jgi:hypothetical protein